MRYQLSRFWIIWALLAVVGLLTLLPFFGSPLTEIFYQWMRKAYPQLSSSDVLQIQGILRKIVHFLMFATVGFVLAQGLQRANQLKIIRRSDASPSLTRLALLVTILLGASDELFQMFVPDRRASLFDVAIDSLGAACGIWIWWTRDHRTIPSPQSRPPHLNESEQRTGENSEREPTVH